MNAGRIEQTGRARPTCTRTPRTTVRGQLPRHLNLIEAEVDTRSGDDVVGRRPENKNWCCPATRCSARRRRTCEVLVGVRPEKISLTHADDAGSSPEGRNRITGKISNTSFIGVSTQYAIVDCAACPEFEVYAQNIDRDARLRLRRRDRPALEPGAHLRAGRGPVDRLYKDMMGDAGVAGEGSLMSTLTEAPPPLTPAAPEQKPRADAAVGPPPYWLLLLGILWLRWSLLHGADGLPGGLHLTCRRARWRRATRSPGTS